VDADIHYARTSGASIAYRVVGDGPIDLTFVPDYEAQPGVWVQGNRAARL
jgi:hypothetical protein